jgi:hypothetical protein
MMLRKRWDEARESRSDDRRAGGQCGARAGDPHHVPARHPQARGGPGRQREGCGRLLQHSSQRLTEVHYRSKASKLTAVR